MYEIKVTDAERASQYDLLMLNTSQRFLLNNYPRDQEPWGHNHLPIHWMTLSLTKFVLYIYGVEIPSYKFEQNPDTLISPMLIDTALPYVVKYLPTDLAVLFQILHNERNHTFDARHHLEDDTNWRRLKGIYINLITQLCNNTSEELDGPLDAALRA